jgi:phosphinothricin acetyltransferase
LLYLDEKGRKMKIRKAKISEFTAIAKLDRVAWLESFKGEFIPDGEHVWRIWVEFASTFVALDEEDNIIGASLAFPCNHGVYNVHKLFVAKEHRGKGIGTELMRVLLKEIDKLKVDSSLTVYPKNPSAIALYTKLGFKDKRFEKDYYGEEEDRFVLTRKVFRVGKIIKKFFKITCYIFLFLLIPILLAIAIPRLAVTREEALYIQQQEELRKMSEDNRTEVMVIDKK